MLHWKISLIKSEGSKRIQCSQSFSKKKLYNVLVSLFKYIIVLVFQPINNAGIMVYKCHRRRSPNIMYLILNNK